MPKNRLSVGLFSVGSVLLGAAAPGAFGQWSHNPAVNLGVATSASDQNQPKIAPTSDGGCYIVWLDGIASGWDTRLQKLDAHGVPQWPANGVLVADTNFSSTEDYGIAVDANDNAVIAYRDQSSGTVQVEVQKVSPGGTLLWNAAGVQVSNGSSNSPRVCATTDGGFVAAWTQSGVARIQKLDADGNLLWTAGGVSDTPPAGLYFLSDLVADDAGGAIALYHHQTGGFSSPRHLKAQKFASADGAKLWNGGSPVIVFNGGSIQLGNFPSMTTDGAGGFVTGWYDTGNARNVWTQHITAAGAEVFPHNGVSIASDIAGRIRTAAAAAYDASTGETYLLAQETNSSTQNIFRLLAQKFDATGARQWSDAGVQLVPDGATQFGFIQAQPMPGAGAIAMWYQGAANAVHVKAAGLASNGAFAWASGIVEPCTVNSNKARLWSARSKLGGSVVLAWGDSRTDANDIYAQRLNFNGTLGTPGDANDNGAIDVDDLFAVINGWGDCPPPPAFCPADLDGNGTIDIDDLFIVINNWS